MRFFTIVILIALVSTGLSTRIAMAEPTFEVGGKVSIEDKAETTDSNTEDQAGPHADDGAAAAKRRAYLAKYRRAWADYSTALAVYSRCAATAVLNSCRAPRRPNLRPPVTESGPVGGEPLIDGPTAANIALARLELTPPRPTIGPAPSLNKWKMVAVGYPLWLSVSGDTRPPAAHDEVAGLEVTLNARVSKVVFDMGDGHRVSCSNVTASWTRSVPAGAKSAVCGYAYAKPSLPRGKYTVTANTVWSVEWSTSSERGVLDYVQSATAQLPVGELQVLVR